MVMEKLWATIEAPIKLRASGLRVVYQLRRTETEMLVIVIGVRADEEVYEIAQKRSNQYNLLG